MNDGTMQGLSVVQFPLKSPQGLECLVTAQLLCFSVPCGVLSSPNCLLLVFIGSLGLLGNEQNGEVVVKLEAKRVPTRTACAGAGPQNKRALVVWEGSRLTPSKADLTFSDRLRAFKGKSGLSSRCYVMVTGVCMESSLWQHSSLVASATKEQ